MIYLITKEEFKKKVNREKDFTRILIKKLKGYNPLFPNQAAYFEIPEKGVFMYVPDLSTVLVPKSSKVIVTDIRNNKVSVTNWKLIKDEGSYNKYTLNEFRRANVYTGNEEKIIESGNYILQDDLTGYKIEFSTYYYDADYWKATYICFSEKLEKKVDIIKSQNKEKFIRNILLWEKKK